MALPALRMIQWVGLLASSLVALAPGARVSRTRTWRASDARIENPERGFYRYVELTDAPDLRRVRAGGDRLVFALVRLDRFRDAPISAELLARLDRGLGSLRAAGLKVILRFAYNAGPYPDPEPDAPLPRVLAHLRQLTPVLRGHADVILLMQAGFIGAWGEWHSSTRGLDAPAARRAVLSAVLAALPPDRMTQLRYPADKRVLFGSALRSADAFSGLDAARVGFHNDCFLASDNDEGTWPARTIAEWQRRIAAEGRFTPVGGESCRENAPRTDGPTALAEMRRLRFSFVNRDWHPAVVQAWFAQGAGAEMERRLGYRLALTQTAITARARRGHGLRVRVTLRNEGWAALFNPRPVRLVLVGSGEPAVFDFVGIDPRRWAPGQTVSFAQTFTLPATLAPGEHRVALWLPDASARLAARPDYAVRLANDGTWDAARGWNLLDTVRVE